MIRRIPGLRWLLNRQRLSRERVLQAARRQQAAEHAAAVRRIQLSQARAGDQPS